MLSVFGRDCQPKNTVVCIKDVVDLFTSADFRQINILNGNSIVKTNMEIIDKFYESFFLGAL